MYPRNNNLDSHKYYPTVWHRPKDTDLDGRTYFKLMEKPLDQIRITKFAKSNIKIARLAKLKVFSKSEGR